MSATPMFDSPSEIIDLINLLLINDNKPKIRKIFILMSTS